MKLPREEIKYASPCQSLHTGGGEKDKDMNSREEVRVQLSDLEGVEWMVMVYSKREGHLRNSHPPSQF